MRVYLDNNILIDIEDGVYVLDEFLTKPRTDYYYSDAHISELLNGLDKSIPGLKEKRLQTIKSLCGENYLVQDTLGNGMRLAKYEPLDAFERAASLGWMRLPINRLAQGFTPNRPGILSELDLDSREVGSLNPNEVFEVIEKHFLASKYHYTIMDYLFLSEAFTGRTVFSSLFNLLDMVGYHKDKNNVARLYDSSHAYYAHTCSVLVSNDTRMRLKTAAVYHFLHINTKILDAKSFLAYTE